MNKPKHSWTISKILLNKTLLFNYTVCQVGAKNPKLPASLTICCSHPLFFFSFFSKLTLPQSPSRQLGRRLNSFAGRRCSLHITRWLGSRRRDGTHKHFIWDADRIRSHLLSSPSWQDRRQECARMLLHKHRAFRTCGWVGMPCCATLRDANPPCQSVWRYFHLLQHRKYQPTNFHSRYWQY